MTIEEFISERIAEDEAIAHAATGQRGDQHSAWHVSGSTQAKGIESGGHLETIWEDEPAEWVDGFVVVYGEGSPSDEQAEHIARHDPARVLRQCAALRAVLQHVETMISPSQQVEAEGDVLYPIAAIWSDHLDYQQDWGLRT